jgi:ATP-binding cassette, subfamily A (ABC1), member 3
VKTHSLLGSWCAFPFRKFSPADEQACSNTDIWLTHQTIPRLLSFIAGAMGTFIVRERETKAKHLQTVAGVQPLAYWLSSYLWDCINYILPCGIVIILMFAFDISVLTTTDRGVVYGVIALLILFGPAAAGFTYIISFLFTSPAICFVAVVIGDFIMGVGGALTVFILVLVSRIS